MGAWQEIVDYTVPSNTTSVVLDSFGTITKDDFVKIVFNCVNANTSNFLELGLTFNSENTNADYTRQRIRGIGTSVGASRSNFPAFGSVETNKTGTTFSYLKLSENNVVNVFSNNLHQDDSSLRLQYIYTTSSGATFPSGITSMTFTSYSDSGTPLIGTGSRIQIYKLAATKVADITVGSNTTQVDISNLSIDKDSEYLLVADIQNNNNAVVRYRLTPNDLTTTTNYYSQMIAGEVSSPLASRNNQNILEIARENGVTVAYAHIKLSNIGAYTHQSYGLRAYGTTAPEVRNWSISSTAENITSVTKLNIVADASNSIKSGSRFILYKLY